MVLLNITGVGGVELLIVADMVQLRHILIGNLVKILPLEPQYLLFSQSI